jgi:DNA-binding HxlR family transcriptional regulator
MQRKPYFGCPIKATTDTLAGKWKVMIVWQLSFGTLRFAELRDLLPGVSEKVLTEQLRQLEADGIVSRTAARSAQPRVEYALTAAGSELIPIMEKMCDWAASHLGVVRNIPRPSTVMTV